MALAIMAIAPISVTARSMTVRPVVELPSHGKKPKHGARVVKPKIFRPTCNLDSNSVGFYFYPPNEGAKWTLRTISEDLDANDKPVRIDTTFSFERIISVSNRTLQQYPVLECVSSTPYHAGQEASAKLSRVEYYVDDSIIMTVFDHSITSGLNHFMLVNPLRPGASWRDMSGDTIRTMVVAMKVPVRVPYGNFSNALEVRTPAGFGQLTKYFVPGVGIVKVVFRGIPPQENGAFVVTTELIALNRGNPKQSIKQQFQRLLGRPKASRRRGKR